MDLLFQNGGELYNGTGESTSIDEEAGVKAFEMHTRFFTHYKLPTLYNFVNRFRSGEMPLGISSYSTYNTLVVFAPEIRGLWDFTLIPGTLKEDGTIDRSANAWGNCSMMLTGSDNEEKALARRRSGTKDPLNWSDPVRLCCCTHLGYQRSYYSAG